MVLHSLFVVRVNCITLVQRNQFSVILSMKISGMLSEIIALQLGFIRNQFDFHVSM